MELKLHYRSQWTPKSICTPLLNHLRVKRQTKAIVSQEQVTSVITAFTFYLFIKYSQFSTTLYVIGEA